MTPNKRQYRRLFFMQLLYLNSISMQNKEMSNKIIIHPVNFAGLEIFLTKLWMMNETEILQALSAVQEPDLGKDIVTLNMVKDVCVNDSRVSFTVVLTTPACPLKELIRKECIGAIHEQ